jgi:hypothetical protein
MRALITRWHLSSNRSEFSRRLTQMSRITFDKLSASDEGTIHENTRTQHEMLLVSRAESRSEVNNDPRNHTKLTKGARAR